MRNMDIERRTLLTWPVNNKYCSHCHDRCINSSLHTKFLFSIRLYSKTFTFLNTDPIYSVSQPNMASLTPGRTLFCLGNLFYTAGSFLADWNQTHIHNPRWPPHAKFHNGQTMSLGVLLGLASTYFAFRPVFSKLSTGEAKHSVFCAAAIGSMYCAAGVSAIFYPGTHWFDPEYEMKGMTQREMFVLVSK